MKGVGTERPLLTDEERAAFLSMVLGHRFIHKGKLHLPTTLAYNSLHDDKGITELAFEMLRWLGVKPHKLTVSYAQSVSHWDQVLVADSTILICAQYRSHPYMAGAAVALGALQYALQKQSTTSVDRMLIEYASIYTGLGLWILNALQPQLTWAEKIYHIIDARWIKIEGMSLRGYNIHQYADHVSMYAHNNRLLAEEYLPNIGLQSRHLLPDAVSKHSSQHLVDPQQVRIHKINARTMWFRILLCASIAAAAIIIGFYLYAQKVPGVSNEQLQHEYSLLVLKRSHQECEQQANDQRNQYDPNDLFLDRQVEATESRCLSLRNQYNHAVEQYNDLYRTK